jgi:hypothetical protein
MIVTKSLHSHHKICAKFPKPRLDFDAACIRTGNAGGPPALGTDRSTVNDVLVCKNCMPRTPGNGLISVIYAAHASRPLLSN